MSANNTPKTLASYTALTLAQLKSTFSKDFCLPIHKFINRAKCVIAIDRKRDNKGSLSSFMREEFGVVDSNLFKPVRVFRDLVAVDKDGTPLDTAGAGEITEAHFDKLLAPTIHINASSILGVIEKRFEKDPEGAAPWKEKLADVLRNHQNTGDTNTALEVLKVQLKPSNEKDKEKQKEQNQQPQEPETDATKGAVPATPEQVLAHVANANFWTLLLKSAKSDPESAVRLASLAQAVTEAAAGAVPILMDFATPTAKAA